MQDIYVNLAKLRTALEKKLTHPFLAKHLPVPKIDEDKLLLFYAIFDEVNLSNEMKENYILTAMLVQVALDTHDEVTTSAHLNQDQFVQRQLTVLAGDYYSGLYYSLLSEMKDIKMVRTLAMAIKEINEHKIRLYNDPEFHSKISLESMLIIETALFQKVSEHMEVDSWRKLATKFLSFKRLSNETVRDETNLATKSHKGSIVLATTYVKDVANKYFEETVSLIENSFFKSPPMKNFLLKRLHSIRFNENIQYNKTVEEGL
ncbi:heptaprenyl diphosphate synthase component 1 [Metabacillus herbersteinensis]|uniref:Heptaprenyl diphosphate synthase component 1 n=1 Tax=Metabacillus herbersteinensis TaxID=283816 RepID=A0ABV6GD48_9BACI